MTVSDTRLDNMQQAVREVVRHQSGTVGIDVLLSGLTGLILALLLISG